MSSLLWRRFATRPAGASARFAREPGTMRGEERGRVADLAVAVLDVGVERATAVIFRATSALEGGFLAS